MIDKITFIQAVRDIFRKDETIQLKPLTVIVGDNGTGKSTFLGVLKDELLRKSGKTLGNNAQIISWTNAGSRLDSYVFCDFEKDNPRTLNDENRLTLFSVASRITFSHGESVLYQMEHHFSHLKNALILLDEPDQCLSPRSSYRLARLVKKYVSENHCQVVMTCHSVPLMEEIGDVYSMEHRSWLAPKEFLKLQKTEDRQLRWVDDSDQYKDPYVLATMNDGRELYLCDEESALGLPFDESIRTATAFDTKEDASSKADSIVGKTYTYRKWGDKKKVTVVSAKVVMRDRM